MAPPPVEAQNTQAGTDAWVASGGAVEVSTDRLDIDEGGELRYRIRLTRRLPLVNPDDPTQGRVGGWWLRVHVDGAVRVTGDYDVDGDGIRDISWAPSVGWEFNPDDWPTEDLDNPNPNIASNWREVTVHSRSDLEASVDFTHEVWDDNAYCPPSLHGIGTVTVDLIADRPPESLPELSIRDASRVTEGGAASFEVWLSKESQERVTVRYETEGGTALEDTDFDRAAGTLTFDPNDRVETIQVQTTNDALDEPDENFTVMLSSPSGATLDDDTGTGTIRDDDDAPKLSINGNTVTEGGTAEFEVTLDNPSGQDVTVRVRTHNGTARSDSDYDAVDTTLTFPAGETRKTVDVQTTDDDDYEADEDFTVRLSSPNGAAIEDGTGNGTILDDDDPPQVFIENDVTVDEGDTAQFVVKLSATSSLPVTVRYATMEGTAVEGADYTRASGTLTFRPGQDRKAVDVRTREDGADEGTETFTLELNDPQDASLGSKDTATGTITDDDDGGLPEVSIDDASPVDEGGTARFTVRLTVPASGTVTVRYRSKDGTAVAGRDYDAVDETLSFDDGNQTKTISVLVLDDQTAERTEEFTVELSGPVGAVLGDRSGRGTITDNDSSGQPALSIHDARPVTEGETARFLVKLSADASQTVTVAYRTVDGTARSGTDYTSNSGTLQFEAGTSEQTIAVDTEDDGTEEPTEHFTVELSTPTGATVEDDTATGMIEDNDEGGGTGGLPSVSIEDAGTVVEGGTAEFVVRLSAESGQVVTVAYETRNGTATAGSDFEATEGTLRFEPGDTKEKITVSTLEDDTVEETEDFTIRLSDPVQATLNRGTATARIIDPGGLPTLVITDAAPVVEGDTAEFVVTLSPSSTAPVTVAFTTEDGSALDGPDYTAKAGTLRFEPGDTKRTITVSTADDGVPEETETFTVKLTGPSGATLADDTGTGTITDNDDGRVGLPTLTIMDAAPVIEGGTAEFAVSLSRSSRQAVTVAFTTADGVATAASDYTSTAGTLRFEPGDTTQTIQVPTLDDEILEQTEHFTVELSEPAGATVEDGAGAGTITDNDDGQLPALAVDDAAPVIEGVAALFPVTLSAPSEQAVTVAFATADGTAASGADYTGASGTLTFEPGVTLQTIEVATLDDEAEEPEERFTVALSEPAGATLEDDTGTGTIRDDDDDTSDFPALSIADAAPVVEGGTAGFPVTLSAPVEHVVTVSYATADGTARSGLDYIPVTGTLRLEPGDTAGTIRVPALDDEIREETEDFTVTLSGPSGGTLAHATGRGTITDNDDGKLPALAIADAPPVTEGQVARFVVMLSAPSEQSVTVAYATAAGSATAGADYVSREGILSFPAGTTHRTIEIMTRQDEFVESEERFTVGLSNATGVVVEDDSGTGTIVDDDLVEGLPTLTIADAPAVSEGGTAGFVVTLSPASEQVVRVSYRTEDDTAEAGLDYTGADGMLRFEPGETTRTVAVTTLTDELVEGPERFTVELSDSVAAVVRDATGVGTITEMAERIAMVNRTVLPELGRALAFSAATCRFDRGLSGPTNRGPQGLGGSLSLSHGPTSDRLTSIPPTVDPLTSHQPGSDPRLSPMHGRSVLERAPGDSSFLMPLQEEEEGGPGRLAAWGCGDYRNLRGGGNGGVAWNGEAFSLSVGADVRLGSGTLAGLSVSRSRGSFDYRAGGSSGEVGGSYEVRLKGVHPYVGWSVSPELDIWGVAGHAWGELRIEDDLAARPLLSAATLDSGAVGVNGRLLAQGATSLTLKGEGALARFGIAGDGGLVEALAVSMWRLRLSTEASHDILYSSGASLTPWGELGLRHDGGAGVTGAGLEVGGGLRYRNPRGWTTEGYGRWLATHQGALREWGFGAVLRYDPGTSGRGPSVSLMPGWGDTASGVQRLWERGTIDPTVPGAPGSRLDAQFGYGLAAFRGRGVLTPFGTVSLDREYGRGYRLGSRLAVGRSTHLSLEVERRERAAAAAALAIFVRGAVRF